MTVPPVARLDSGEALRDRLMRSVKAHFQRGGGDGSRVMSEVAGEGAAVAAVAEAAMAAAPLVRAYAAARRRLLGLGVAAWNCVARGVAVLSLGALRPALRTARAAGPSVDLGRVLHTLVRVHGEQMLLDGVYNADPHPGNVIVLADGRLGLIDYGMVGRLGPTERVAIARVVVALAEGGEAAKREVAEIYWGAGYRACWHSGEPHGADAVHRFATFHLDRIDLSPVRVGAPEPGRAARTMPIMDLLQSTIEHAVPDWVEQGRRLGGLLIGVGSQTARPISLAHEWLPIARRVLLAVEKRPADGAAAARSD